eukprot:GHVT01088826.1.p1 GENE.GHVT01088826.1~~GHVT01088826.1.p1  ORF type:complete len:306 (+),score=33.01 GHVT01088826.1:1547-2464(+)
MQLRIPIGDEHRHAFLWYATKVGKNAKRFSVEVGPQAPVRALKIALDEPAEITPKDELAVIHRHATLVMQKKIDVLSNKAKDCKNKALNSSRAGNKQEALKILSFAKLYEKQCEELYNYMYQLDNAWSSHNRAEIFVTLQTALKATTTSTKDVVDAEAMMDALDDARDVREAVNEVNEKIAELGGTDDQISEEGLRDELERLAAEIGLPDTSVKRIDTTLATAPSPPTHNLEPAEPAHLVEDYDKPVEAGLNSVAPVGEAIACAVPVGAGATLVAEAGEAPASPSSVFRGSSETEMSRRIQRLRS